MYAILVPWDQSNENLMWAIETRAHLRLTLRLAKEWIELGSEFIGGTELQSLLIRKFPGAWNNRLLAGQLLPCSFRKGHKKYMFVTAVMDEKTVEVDGQQETAFVLAWPEGLQEMQRRHFYRAAVPDQFDLAVKIWDSVPAIGQTPTAPPLAVGKLIDVSAGGAQIELPTDARIQVDRGYLLEIELPTPEQPVLVQARSRHTDGQAPPGASRFGMQFLSLDYSPRGQETMMRLARFANYLRSCETVAKSRSA
ncbi:MAG: PilZ domain-containing protein [Phycisphaerae bacterium]|nr:PilZ domain-containing protein [Phycisphaerae bacterium]